MRAKWRMLCGLVLAATLSQVASVPGQRLPGINTNGINTNGTNTNGINTNGINTKRKLDEKAVIHHKLVIHDKTLVAWVYPANLVQRGGAVLTVENPGGVFDAIVFGELRPGVWMAGSDGFRRTWRQQQDWPTETAGPGEQVQVAIVYQGRQVTLYRNGRQNASYTMETEPVTFGEESMGLLGLRHTEAARPDCFFAGAIEDARIYNTALTAAQVAALRCGQPSHPEPAAWWSFASGKAVDRMGAFPEVDLVGDAHIARGKLQLGGHESYLTAASLQPGRYTSPIHYRPRRGRLADTIPFYWKGEYHIFYLHGGVGKVPWKHIVSIDLVHWKELPDALLPDGDPDGFDGENMFTGSVIEKDGTFHIFYTGWNPRNPRGRESILHATSPDLVHWNKHPEDRIDPDGVHYSSQRERDFRDAYVFWNDQEQQYWMVLCANSLQGGGPGLAVSRDLKNWTESPALDAPNQECPDLFRIGDTWYLLGGDTYRFSKNPHGPFKDPPLNNVIDRPFIYAGKRMFDGKRHVWTGWLWDRSPEQDDGAAQWGGTQCLPRELYAGPGGELWCRPVKEVRDLFRKTVVDLAARPKGIRSSSHWEYGGTGLSGVSGSGSQFSLDVPDHYRLNMKIQLDPGAVFTVVMREQEEPGSGYRLVLRPREQEAEIAGPTFHYPRHIELDAGKPITIEAYVSGTMIETFINDRYALSCRGYNYRSGRLGLNVTGGGVRVLEMRVMTE